MRIVILHSFVRQRSTAPGFSPPGRRWAQFVEELSVTGRDCAVAAWPAPFPKNDRTQRALLTVNAGLAIAFMFALLQLFVQLAHSFIFISGTLHTLQVLYPCVLVFVVVYMVSVEFLRT